MDHGLVSIRDDPLDFRMFNLANDDDRIAFLAEATGIFLGFFYKGAGRIDNVQVVLLNLEHLFSRNPV